MPNEYAEFRDWLSKNRGTAETVIDAAFELYEHLRPLASRNGKTVAELVLDDPIVVRAVVDSAGLASIAGRRGISAEQVLNVVALIAKAGMALLAVA